MTLPVLLTLAIAAGGAEREPTYEGKSLSHWKAQAGHADPAPRMKAAEALGHLGKTDRSALPVLAELLLDNDRAVRQAAFRPFYGYRMLRMDSEAQKAAIPVLVSMIGDERPEMRSEGMCYLTQWGTTVVKAAIPELKSLLQHAHPDARYRAAVLLLKYPESKEAAIPIVVELSCHEDPKVRAQSIFPLCRYLDVPEFSQALVELLEDPAPDVRQGTAFALQVSESGPRRQAAKDFAPALTKALGDESSAVRANAAAALGWIGAEARAATPALITLLDDADPDVRRAAIFALMKSGPEVRATAIPRILKSQNARLIPLYTLKATDNAAVRALIELLRDEDEQVRRNASNALANLYPEVRRAAVPYLASLLTDKEPKVRLLVLSELRKIGWQAQSSLAAIAALERDDSAEVRRRAAGVLGSIASAAKDSHARIATLGLAQLLQDKEPDVRRAAANALGRMGAPAKDAIGHLTRTLQDPAPRVRASAATALGRMRDEGRTAIPVLTQTLQDPELLVRVAAAGALGRMGDDTRDATIVAIPDLVRALRAPELELRSTACDALTGMGGDTRAAAVRALNELLQDESPDVQKDAEILRQAVEWLERVNTRQKPRQVE